MMKVTIEVNGIVIGEMTAQNQGPPSEAPEMMGFEEADRKYELADGSTLIHNREDGAAALAKRMLDRMEMKPEYVSVTSE